MACIRPVNDKFSLKKYTVYSFFEDMISAKSDHDYE